MNKFFISLLLIINFTFANNKEYSGINAPYPVALQLMNNDLFIANRDGMFFCNQNLNCSKEHEYSQKYISNFETILNKVLIAQFTHGGNVICIVENVFYFFDGEGNFIISGDLPNEIDQTTYINLLAYEKNIENNFHFIVTFMDSTKKIIFLYHYIINQTTFNIVSNNTYSPFYFDYPNIEINSKYFTCQIMDSSEKGNVLTCCFETYENHLIVIQSFDIDNNLAEIEEYYAKTPIDSLNMITSAISEDKKDILVCFSPRNYYGYCFSYNYDLNEISNYNIFIEKCTTKYPQYKLNYFKETKQYVLICENDNKFTVILFNKDFQVLNPDNITTSNFEILNHYTFNSISVVYNTNEGKYVLISDPKSDTIDECHTDKFELSINLTQNFPSALNRPSDLVEVFEDKEYSLKETNKYYVYTKDYTILRTSNESSKIIIDFMDINNLIIYKKDNTPIDTNLYSFYITIDSKIGRLTAEVDGEEKTLDKINYVSNITHLNYYAAFSDVSYSFSFNILLYLKNKTLASKSLHIAITVCQQNCSCEINNLNCNRCLQNFVSYKSQTNCKSLDDLGAVVYDENQRFYIDCYKMCKTCSRAGYDENNMNCLTCYEEYGDYMGEYNKCYEKQCNNLYYKDKGKKICIEEDSCPDGYPILNATTKECENTDKILTEEPTFEQTSSTQPSTGSTTPASTALTSSTNPESSDSINESTAPNDDESSSTTQTSALSTQPSTPSTQPSSSSTHADINESDESPTNIMDDKSHYTSTNEEPHTDSKSSETNKVENDDIAYQQVMNIINELVGQENIDQINKTYSVLSDSIKNGDISSFSKDVTITGTNITYQITTSDNQKNSDHNTNISVIDLGECEKIIKRNISNEDDPTPLLILKIDVKKGKSKTTAVEYEVYNPYTRGKIDLSICANTNIVIYAPVDLNNKEILLYDELSGQGYDLFDVNNSFYIDPCAPYTSSNGTDVSLEDRKNYYYNEDIVLCEDSCKYVEVNTKNEKVLCNCTIKNEVNVESDQDFTPQKLLEQFYKVNTYSNFEVLYCYKLLFSSDSLKKNICFYIMLVLFSFFVLSMIVNLISAMKKIDEIIFKIFQDRFMYYFLQKSIVKGKKKRNAKGNINLSKENSALKLSWSERLKKAKGKNLNKSSTCGVDGSSNKKNLYKNNGQENKNTKYLKHYKKKKLKNDSLIGSNIPLDINDNEKLIIKGKKHHKKRYNLERNETNVDNNENIIKQKYISYKNAIKELKINSDNNLNNENNKNEHNINNKKSKKEHSINNENNDKEYNIKDDNNQPKNETKKKVSNININIINNIIHKQNQNPPIKRKSIVENEKNVEETNISKVDNPNKLQKRKSKVSNKRAVTNEVNSSVSNSAVIINLKKLHPHKKNKLKKSLFSVGDAVIEEKAKKLKIKNDIGKQQPNDKDAKKNIKYIDEELNRMDFEEALEYDKRTYWQYYWSLLKKKHMIVLTFVSNDDYNVFTLKFSLFILSVALFFSINTLFFNDSSMHRIFIERGKYNLLYQIPQVIYSTLISFLMTFILKKLSLSQNELIDIKKELDQTKSKQLADQSKKCFQIKLYSFFFFGLTILIFFCYYISAFAAVYVNTQIHLIKDTVLSFGISMSYPFAINLFPGLFRQSALKDGTKEKECIFKTGQILALI